jgi:hypothetical protein
MPESEKQLGVGQSIEVEAEGGFPIIPDHKNNTEAEYRRFASP